MIDTFRIRCNILSSALSGKLTCQYESDGTALDIISNIKSLDVDALQSEAPYEIPSSWRWAKLSDIYEINPRVIAEKHKDAAFISMDKISPGFERGFSFDIQSWEKASKAHTKFMDGDVAFAKISPCFENRKSFIASNLPNGIGGGTTELIILRQALMNPYYTYYLITDSRFIKTGSSSYKGIVGQQRLKADIYKNYLVPIPPRIEQDRIVEQVEKTFEILDTIDSLQNDYLNNLELLREKVIEAAIHGQLTDQLGSDSNVELLLKRNNISPTNQNEKNIPKTWCYAQFSKLCKIQTGTSIPEQIKRDKYQGYPDGYPYIGTKDVGFNHEVDYDNGVRIPFDEPKFVVAETNSVLLCVEGGSAGRKLAIINQNVCYGNKLCKFYSNIIESRYIYYYLQSYSFKKLFRDKVTGLIGGVNITTLRKLDIPVPPVEEQKRIVEKLDSLLSIFKE